MKNYNIRIPFNAQNEAKIAVNETLLYQDAAYVIEAFKKSMG